MLHQMREEMEELKLVTSCLAGNDTRAAAKLPIQNICRSAGGPGKPTGMGF
jgi:hypothetical protein